MAHTRKIPWHHTVIQMVMVAAFTLASASVSVAAQASFSTPEEAVEALIAANRENNQTELLHILGPQSAPLIRSGDATADDESRHQFLDAYDTAHTLEADGDDKKLLVVGDNQWPLPIPLVHRNGSWQFDSAAGQQEILNRRIGRNELNVIEVCRDFVEAQFEYAADHRLANGKREYAQRFLSHPGKQDGLYWPVTEGIKESPLGPLLAFAQAEGHTTKTHAGAKPYHGYYYKILTEQSANAPGGAMHYIVGHHMTGGFALVAFPAKYGDSGIMTFMVNQNGIVHERDLGPDTARIAAGINTYDPDKNWKLPKR